MEVLMHRCVMLVCALLREVGWGQPPAPLPKPPLKLPDSIKAAPGQLVAVRPETEAKAVWWHVPPGVQFDSSDGRRKLLLVANATGRYPLVCFIAAGKDEGAMSDAWVILRGAPPPPTGGGLRKHFLSMAAGQ